MQRTRTFSYSALVVSLVAAAMLAVPGIASASVSLPVDSYASDWTYMNYNVVAGRSYTVTTPFNGTGAQPGSWTVDYRSFPYVSADGYSATVDAKIWQGCKILSNLPYGRLLARIGYDGPIFSVGTKRTFTADRSGQLLLHINDQNGCRDDNDGWMRVSVSP